MKSFKFFRGYVDPITELSLDLETVHIDTEYRALYNPYVYMGVDVADGPDRYDRVGTRIINATWTREMAEDISHFHNIDAEAELTALLTEQISHEIDRNTLRAFRQMGASMAFSRPFELRRINNQIEVSQAGVRFLRSDNTPIVQGII